MGNGYKHWKNFELQTRLLCRDCWEKWIFEDVLEECQMELRDGLLETGGKVILVAMNLAELFEGFVKGTVYK